jgi:hypothetical protein
MVLWLIARSALRRLRYGGVRSRRAGFSFSKTHPLQFHLVFRFKNSKIDAQLPLDTRTTPMTLTPAYEKLMADGHSVGSGEIRTWCKTWSKAPAET